MQADALAGRWSNLCVASISTMQKDLDLYFCSETANQECFLRATLLIGRRLMMPYSFFGSWIRMQRLLGMMRPAP